MAIDLGRFKSVACVYDRTATFHTLASGRGDFASRFASHLNALVVVEACGRADGAADLRSACDNRVRMEGRRLDERGQRAVQRRVLRAHMVGGRHWR